MLMCWKIQIQYHTIKKHAHVLIAGILKLKSVISTQAEPNKVTKITKNVC